MIVKGILKGDRVVLELFYGTDKKCKRWISERDLNMFSYLAIIDDQGKVTLKVV